jgi:hypothetical protein
VNLVQQGLANFIRGFPQWAATNLPKWVAKTFRAYIGWLWQLDPVMKFMMLIVNAIVIVLLVGRLKLSGLLGGQFEQVAVLLAFCFFAASMVFGRRGV